MKSELLYFPYKIETCILFISNRDPSDEESKARKIVRSNNFTQQTNALDVDKHMLVICLIVDSPAYV